MSPLFKKLHITNLDTFDYRFLQELESLPIKARYEKVLKESAIRGQVSSVIDQLINTHLWLIKNKTSTLHQWDVGMKTFVDTCRELYYDLLVGGDAYLSIIPIGYWAPLRRLHPLLLEITGGVSMETTSYVYDGRYPIPWNGLIHVSLVNTPNVGWRYFGWLPPRAEVVVSSCEKISDAVGQLLASCIIAPLMDMKNE